MTMLYYNTAAKQLQKVNIMNTRGEFLFQNNAKTET